ncbi:MAG TPA: nitrile hydratase [Acidimicrobiia bacterium]|nr:nitrile hydratase [Acidimicrobiia bacterium]
MAAEQNDEQRDTVELEQALTQLAWADPSIADDPAAALARLGVTVPDGLRIDVRIQQPDTLNFVIPPTTDDGGEVEGVVNQMDLWRSGDQFVWIMPQDAKVALLDMREQCRHHQQAAP